MLLTSRLSGHPKTLLHPESHPSVSAPWVVPLKHSVVRLLQPRRPLMKVIDFPLLHNMTDFNGIYLPLNKELKKYWPINLSERLFHLKIKSTMLNILNFKWSHSCFLLTLLQLLNTPHQHWTDKSNDVRLAGFPLSQKIVPTIHTIAINETN